MEVWQHNLIAAGVFAVALLTLMALRNSPGMLAFRAELKRRRGARIALYVLGAYVLIGALDQFRLPARGAELERTPIDFAFSIFPRERTYSAPFAERLVAGMGEDPHAPENRLRGKHILGTDINGYDVLHQTARGAGTALTLTVGVLLICLPLGLLIGGVAGYFGGLVDDAAQWLYTTLASVPWLLFTLAFLIVFGRSLFWLCLAFGLASWTELARLARAETLRLRESGYVRAARALGASPWRILRKHILPNLTHIVIVQTATTASMIILAETALTFIGIGAQPGSASWGLMLTEAQTELIRTPPIWWVFAGAATLGALPVALALNALADALRDALDPRLHK